MVPNDESAESVRPPCVLLFSGGRDSTLAAARLAGQCRRLVLLTVSTSHLVGIERVRSRLAELGRLFVGKVDWMHVSLSADALRPTASDLAGCLTCQHAYLAVAAKLAKQMEIETIALGYTAYQSGWVEQSPYAIFRLTEILAKLGKQLLLPVSNIQSKEQAKRELSELGLSENALEQKCSLQQTNDHGLDERAIRTHIDRWAENLDLLLANDDRIDFRVLETKSAEGIR
jgi:hypothetical protein